MSNSSQRSQHQPGISSDGYGITTNENNDLLGGRILSQPYPSPNKHVTVSSTINLNLNISAGQQLQETNVTVNLFDCMKCCVRIPRCEVEEQIDRANKNTLTDFVHRGRDLREERDILSDTTLELDLDHQIQELREEQENLSHNQQNTILSPSNEKDF